MNVWTISGSDPSGLAGMQADLDTFRQLGLNAGSIVSAITAQNTQALCAIEPISSENVAAQCRTLIQTLKPEAIKIGMLGCAKTIECIGQFLTDFQGPVILDPVFNASSKQSLIVGDPKHYRAKLIELFPKVSLLTPNRLEAEALLNTRINGYRDVVAAAKALLDLGAQSVLLKGGHIDETEFCQDYWTDGKDSFWLASPRLAHKNYRGTGCVLSAAIAAALALGHTLPDALVIGKMYISRGIKHARALDHHNYRLFHGPWPQEEHTLPLIAKTPIVEERAPFPPLPNIGLYPIVDNSRLVLSLSSLGVRVLQLRIKEPCPSLVDEIKQSISYAKANGAKLLINDHWQLALQLGAFGVHLGQEDLEEADLEAIRSAGLYLGLSTHGYYELAKAYTLKPSYLACGPIYATQSKAMSVLPQGIQQLQRYRNTLPHYPLVAIGGINLMRMPEVLSTKVDGIAVLSAITTAADLKTTTQAFLMSIDGVTHEQSLCTTDKTL
jgi:hydroxymethylpyrimidine kinase/phosphomethylpyrimidine kinase/thiamine-phosphate diphosphorylase